MIAPVLRLLALAALIAAAAVPPGPAAAVTLELSSRVTSRSIAVSVGRPILVETDKPFAEVVVGDPTIADVTPLTDQSFMVHGIKAGITGLLLLDADKDPVGSSDVEVSPHLDRLQAALASKLPGAKIDVSAANGKILLSGSSDDPQEIEDAKQIASQFAGEPVVAAVDLSGTRQVQLEVRFLEASRSAGKELGIRWGVSGSDFAGSVGGAGLTSGSPFGALVGSLLTGGVRVDLLIQALERRGLARRLAEPNLTALSGDNASFLAGGEFPFPVSSKDGEVTVAFRKFGVGLDFTPTVKKDGLIHLVISPEVSQLDPTVSVKVGDVEVPSITVRRATTTVELRDGQSFVIAGLLQNTFTVSQDRVPWLGDVPVLGALFRSAGYRKQETDLVIIVTPRLVAPMDPGQTVATPLDKTLPGNDVDLFLGGQAEVVPTAALSYAAAGTDPAGGYILDLPQVR